MGSPIPISWTCPACGAVVIRRPRERRDAVQRWHLRRHCYPPEAWCGCGTRFAGTALQIAAAAATHWTICTAPWRLHLRPTRSRA